MKKYFYASISPNYFFMFSMLRPYMLLGIIILCAGVFFWVSAKTLESSSETPFITYQDISYTRHNIMKLLEKRFLMLWEGDILQANRIVNQVLDIRRAQEVSQSDMYWEINILLSDLSEYFSEQLYGSLREVVLWYSEQGRPIRGYYKGKPEDGYKLLIGNIHGAYEYGAYETSLLLLEKLKNTDVTGWFIIPTLNPDGLEIYKERWNTQSFYLEGRSNTRGIDLNRNFCTKNFLLQEIEKFGLRMRTWNWGCQSERESQVLVNTLEAYTFTLALSLHSRGQIFYIPDNSLTDGRVRDLWYSLKTLLPDYDFAPDISTELKFQNSLERYEIDEWGVELFTGTIESYIYETLDIPVILIELSEHGQVEERLLWVFDILK